MTRAGHGQTSILTSTLFTGDQTLLSPSPFIIPRLFLPIHFDTTLLLPYVTLKTSHNKSCTMPEFPSLASHNECHPPRQGDGTPQYVWCSRDSVLGLTRPVGLMVSGTALGGQGRGLCLWLGYWGSPTVLCLCAPLHVCVSVWRSAFHGLITPLWWPREFSGSPLCLSLLLAFAVACLLCVEMSILSHNLTTVLSLHFLATFFIDRLTMFEPQT